MKKLFATVLTVLTCGAAYALPVGNPCEANLFTNGVFCESGCCDPCDPCFSWCDAWSLRVGFYGDYVFQRNLELDGHDERDINNTELYTNAAYLALNICDRVDVFTTLGATQLHLKLNSNAFGATSAVDSELFFKEDFSWSIGARATLWEYDSFCLGLEGQYFRTRPDIDYFTNDLDGSFNYFNDADAKYHEWQIGLGVSYRFATSCPTIAFVPYMGLKWSWSKLDSDNFAFATTNLGNLTIYDMESKKLWGYAVGMTFTLCDMVGVNVEGRFGDEAAIAVNGQFRF